MKNTIKLNEAQLRAIVKEAVRNVLKEEVNPEEVQLFSQLYSTYDDKVRNLMSAHAYLLEQQFGYSRDEAMAETAVIMRRDTVGVVPRYQSSNNRVYAAFKALTAL